MANPERGEVSVDIDGKTYTLALTLNVMIELSDLFGMTFDDVVEAAERQDKDSPKYLRGLIWATLQRHHPEISVTDAGDLMSIGNLKRLNSSLAKVVKASAPDPKDVRAMNKGGKPDPPQALPNEAGTGESSTLVPGASA